MLLCQDLDTNFKGFFYLRLEQYGGVSEFTQKSTDFC